MASKHDDTLPPTFAQRSMSPSPQPDHTTDDALSQIRSDELSASPSRVPVHDNASLLDGDEDEDAEQESDQEAEQYESNVEEYESEGKEDESDVEPEVRLTPREKKLKTEEDQDEDYDEDSAEESEDEDEDEYEELAKTEKIGRKGTRTGLRSASKK